jgi:transcriptional regulator with XRE-family HTH domain
VAKNLKDVLAQRPVRRTVVDAHEKRMLEEVRAYRLSELRKASKFTQVELAERMNVAQNRVSSIENGDIERAQLNTLRKYVEAVGGELHVEVEIGDERFLIA